MGASGIYCSMTEIAYMAEFMLKPDVLDTIIKHEGTWFSYDMPDYL